MDLKIRTVDDKAKFLKAWQYWYLIGVRDWGTLYGLALVGMAHLRGIDSFNAQIAASVIKDTHNLIG